MKNTLYLSLLPATQHPVNVVKNITNVKEGGMFMFLEYNPLVKRKEIIQRYISLQTKWLFLTQCQLLYFIIPSWLNALFFCLTSCHSKFHLYDSSYSFNSFGNNQFSIEEYLDSVNYWSLHSLRKVKVFHVKGAPFMVLTWVCLIDLLIYST